MADETRTPLLIVDDEKPIRSLLARIAERAGFQVDTAKDGVEALEMIAAKNYAIVMVDLMMPRLSGYELVQRISTFEPRPTVIVATAMANGDIATLDDSMVRRVIKKPFDIKAVAAALVETAQQIAQGNPPAERVAHARVYPGAPAPSPPPEGAPRPLDEKPDDEIENPTC